MKSYDQKAAKKITNDRVTRSATAVVHSIDCDRVNITVGNSSSLLRGIETVGDARKIVPGSIVPIIWRQDRPFVLQTDDTEVPSLVSNVAGQHDQYPHYVCLELPTAYCKSSYQVTRYSNTSQAFAGLWRAFNAIGDYLEWQFLIDSGVYIMTLLYLKGSTDGIIQAYLDGIYLSEVDQYSASAVFNLSWDIPVTIQKGGVHTVRLMVSGKNASASDYKMGGNFVTICQTPL